LLDAIHVVAQGDPVPSVDGVPMITQNQVAAGRDFTYRFTANAPGTY
jgi:hypothetical protein